MTIVFKTNFDMKTKPLEILYEDNHLLVVNKPVGMLSQGDDTGDIDLLTIAKQYIKEKYQKPGRVFLGLVQRLDRPVSGIMVFARTSKAASRLSEQFRRHNVLKMYLLIAEGNLTGSGKKEDYILKNEKSVSIVSPNTPGSKVARLQWRSLRHDKEQSLISVLLETGRPHQIRLQMADLGHPIIGDFRYGAETEMDGKNMALHCYHLGLEHPVTRQKIYWKKLPEHWPPEFQSAINESQQLGDLFTYEQ